MPQAAVIDTPQDAVAFLKSEHEQIKALFAEVERASGDEREDAFVQLQRMRRAVAFAEKVAPTRPHPGVSLAGEKFLAGPFAMMLDRARDAITGKRG